MCTFHWYFGGNWAYTVVINDLGGIYLYTNLGRTLFQKQHPHKELDFQIFLGKGTDISSWNKGYWSWFSCNQQFSEKSHHQLAAVWAMQVICVMENKLSTNQTSNQCNSPSPLFSYTMDTRWICGEFLVNWGECTVTFVSWYCQCCVMLARPPYNMSAVHMPTCRQCVMRCVGDMSNVVTCPRGHRKTSVPMC